MKNYTVSTDGDMIVEHKRKLDEGSYGEWKNKRMSGFAMRWYFVDHSGQVVNVIADDIYKDEQRNKEFVQIFNILQNAETADNAWQAVKKVRKEWLELQQDRAVSFCSYGMVHHNIIEGFLNDIETLLNITRVSSPEYKGGISKSKLGTAAEMYIYMVTCPTSVTLAWRQFYKDLFTNFSERFILATVAQLSKAEVGENRRRSIPEELITLLDKILDFSFGKIILGLETQAKFQKKIKKGKLTKYSDVLENCFDRNNCQNINQLIRSIGGLLIEHFVT